jgi:hypothetical protein
MVVLLTVTLAVMSACGVVVRQPETAERVDVKMKRPDGKAEQAAAAPLPPLPPTTAWTPPQVVATVPPSPSEAAAPVLDPWCLSINSFIDIGWQFTSTVESSDATALREGIARVAAAAAAMTAGAKPTVAGPAEKLRAALASASAGVSKLQEPDAMRAAVGQAMSSVSPLVDQLLAAASFVCSQIDARHVPSEDGYRIISGSG